ncbi:hypothetical protein [Solimonas sp. SE-A11]|uniref:hypothetical protein n=1 Tax=Solimonas sp. SE-A11 TaxID=3054954 RepID=UPI00259CFE96|nr:hypothetical protein [Solimonas sp. SE-A11]MDM4769715.1 hypothetical protein [Solimonas sp. SE-A11]
MKTRLKIAAVLTALLAAPLTQAGDQAQAIDHDLTQAARTSALEARIQQQMSLIDLALAGSMSGFSLPPAATTGALAIAAR